MFYIFHCLGLDWVVIVFCCVFPSAVYFLSLRPAMGSRLPPQWFHLSRVGHKLHSLTQYCRLKWFHVYRIRLILNHDEHVGRHLHVPNASGKYNAVSCRQSVDLIFSLLYRHASFVLIDKHTYVTLLYRFSIFCNIFFVILLQAKLLMLV